MKKTIFTGAGVAIVTPMNPDGSVNYPKFAEMLEFQISGGTDAIIVCGTTGESATLSHTEHTKLIDYCVEKVNGRVPVIAGTGSNDTAYSLELSKEAERSGVDGMLQVTPYYNKTSQAGLIRHFSYIAERVDVPMILYSVASRTGVNITPETCKELSKCPNIVAIKEASGNISQVAQIAALCGDELQIYSGNDDQTVPLMALGGIGTISVLSNIMPKEMHDLCALCLDGKYDEARKLQLSLIDIMNKMFCDVNPIPVKEAMNLMGFGVGQCRMPLAPMSEANLNAVKEVMKIHSLI